MRICRSLSKSSTKVTQCRVRCQAKKTLLKVKRKGAEKKVLIVTAIEAYKQYKSENPSVKIGKSKFASLRPKNVVPVSEKDQTVCCSVYHENFTMLLEGIRKQQVDLPGDGALITEAVCAEFLDCYMGECDSCRDTEALVEQKLTKFSESADKVVTYWKWTSEYKKEQVETTFRNAKKKLEKQLGNMKRHSFIAREQLRQIRAAKQQLVDSHVVMQEDFAENFNLKRQNEVMSAHWVSNSVTLFTAVISTTEGSNSYVVISDELRRDKFSVTASHGVFQQHMMEQEVNLRTDSSSHR